MKQRVVTFICLLATLVCFVHPLSANPTQKAAPGDAGILITHHVGNLSGQDVLPPEYPFPAAEADAFGKCTFKIDMEIDGVHIEGTLTIEDVNFFECAAMKIAKFFSDLF